MEMLSHSPKATLLSDEIGPESQQSTCRATLNLSLHYFWLDVLNIFDILYNVLNNVHLPQHTQLHEQG